MTSLDAAVLLDQHLKEKTANGNMHPGENWYEKDYREAEDLVWGFTDLNWYSLKKIFEARSHIWQEACVFVLGESSSPGSIRMLSIIFLDGGDKIACYAAIFLCDQEMGDFSDDQTSMISHRLQELLEDEKYKQYGEHYLVSLEKLKEKLALLSDCSG